MWYNWDQQDWGEPFAWKDKPARTNRSQGVVKPWIRGGTAQTQDWGPGTSQVLQCAETFRWHLMTTRGSHSCVTRAATAEHPERRKDKQTSPCRWCHPYASRWDGIPHIRLVCVCRSHSRQETDSPAGHSVRGAQEASNSEHITQTSILLLCITQVLNTRKIYIQALSKQVKVK